MHTSEKKSLNYWLFGVLAWLAFSGAAVLLRGVRWDEAYEHAQILIQLVCYPPYHPLNSYVRGVFSAQTQSAAALLSLGFGAKGLCALRNFFFLAGTLLPIFLLTTALTRRTLWGHAAAAWVLQGVWLEFDGSYPTAVWPNLYSNGPIGGGWALFTLAAALSQHYRLAAFMLGALPCIHIGQFPLLAVWAALCVAYRWKRGTLSALRPAVPYLLAGLACCGVVALIQARLAIPSPTPPVETTDTASAVWEGYTALHDPHRQFPPENGQIVLVGALVLAIVATLKSRGNAERLRCQGVLAYIALIALAVWGTMLAQMLLGNPLPFLLTAWMPFRMINHVPPLLCATLVALLYRNRGAWLLTAMLLFGVFKPLLAPLVGPTLYVRYLAQGECTVFFLFGAALALSVWPRRDVPRKEAALPMVAYILLPSVLACIHFFGALCILAGTEIGILLRDLLPQPSRRPWNPLRSATLAVIAILLAIGAATYHQWRFREELPRSDFDRQVAYFLREHNPSGAPVVTEPFSYYLQARLDQPIFVEATTPSLISYLPRLGPLINRLYTDLYGIDFRRPAPDAAPPKPWETLWSERSTESWKNLAHTYGFRYVLTPGPLPLALTRVMDDGTSTLYVVPGE